jgi:NitT/TauT family transport system ATP-binding protein
MPDKGLRYEQVEKSFPGGVRAVRGIDFEVPAGSLTALLGPSGCGKTTILRLAAGFLQPDQGTIHLGLEIAGSDSIRPGELAYVFQEPNLLPWKRTIDNVALPLLLMGEKRNPARAKAEEWLKALGLEDKAQSYPQELSGGMKMRVSLARALISQPRWVLLDEPFGALDAVTRDKLNLWLRQLQHRHQWTGLLVTHSAAEAVFMADTIHLLGGRPGRMCATLPMPFRSEDGKNLRRHPEYLAAVGDLSQRLQGSSDDQKEEA